MYKLNNSFINNIGALWSKANYALKPLSITKPQPVSTVLICIGLAYAISR